MRRTFIIMTIVLFTLSAVPVFARGPDSNHDKVQCCHSGRKGGHGHGNNYGSSGTHRNQGTNKESKESQGKVQEKPLEQKK